MADRCGIEPVELCGGEVVNRMGNFFLGSRYSVVRVYSNSSDESDERPHILTAFLSFC